MPYAATTAGSTADGTGSTFWTHPAGRSTDTAAVAGGLGDAAVGSGAPGTGSIWIVARTSFVLASRSPVTSAEPNSTHRSNFRPATANDR